MEVMYGSPYWYFWERKQIGIHNTDCNALIFQKNNIDNYSNRFKNFLASVLFLKELNTKC